jgi:hypothetical protein
MIHSMIHRTKNIPKRLNTGNLDTDGATERQRNTRAEFI